MTAFADFRTHGAAMLTVSRDWLSDPDRATRVMLAYARQTMPREKFELISRSPSSIRESIFCGMWAMSGFPTVDLGAKLGAALMSTALPVEDANELVRAPWPAFVIRLPPNLLRLPNSERAVECITTFHHHQGIWSVAAIVPPDAARPLVLWNHQKSFYDLLTNQGLSDDPLGLEFEQADHRVMRMVTLLVAGVCLELSDLRVLKESYRGKASGGRSLDGRRPYGAVPDYDRFELRRAVKIDVRPAIRDYVDHGAKHVTVQTLVRGHWKQQAHGPQHSLRKTLHIEPYWRGDMDAPVSDRSGA